MPIIAIDSGYVSGVAEFAVKITEDIYPFGVEDGSVSVKAVTSPHCVSVLSVSVTDGDAPETEVIVGLSAFAAMPSCRLSISASAAETLLCKVDMLFPCVVKVELIAVSAAVLADVSSDNAEVLAFAPSSPSVSVFV